MGRLLISLTVIVSAILAGANADRLVVQLPAFARVGVVPWARYSRHADLANGRFFCPPLAFGAMILAIAAWIVSPSLTIALAVLLEIAGLLLTIMAAPNMLRVGRTPDEDVATLERAFEGFRSWSTVRGADRRLRRGGLGTRFRRLAPRPPDDRAHDQQHGEDAPQR